MGSGQQADTRRNSKQDGAALNGHGADCLIVRHHAEGCCAGRSCEGICATTGISQRLALLDLDDKSGRWESRLRRARTRTHVLDCALGMLPAADGALVWVVGGVVEVATEA